MYHFLTDMEKNDMRKDTKQEQSKSKKRVNKSKLPIHLEHINRMAAGIGIGSSSHFVLCLKDVMKPVFGSFPVLHQI